MYDRYTIESGDVYLDMLESDLAQMWDMIASDAQDSDLDRIKQRLLSVAREYRFSGRFALMRILQNRMGTGDAEQRVTLESLANLSAEEHIQYLNQLTSIASYAPDSNAELVEKILFRAWHDIESANLVSESQISDQIRSDEKKLERARRKYEKENKKKYGTMLTREEALLLGHLLRFSLKEMQWFLLRVFDTEEGLRLNHADDLIEVYCFTMGKSWRDADMLKEKYREASLGIEKEETPLRGRNWTAQIAGDLSEKMEEWAYYPQTCDDQFLLWLKDHAWGLDVPSYTARKIYRNLAIYAYKLAIGKSFVPEEEDFQDMIQQICSQDSEHADLRYYLYADGKFSEEKCMEFGKDLLREYADIAESTHPDNSKAWAVLTTRPDCTISSTYGIANNSRTRVMELLMGMAEVQKADMLMMLWLIINLVWYDAKEPDDDTLCCRILDLKDAAYSVLEHSLLPTFYSPHLMEQSMMLSVVYGGKMHINPIEVYGYMLQCVKATRNRKPKTES